MNNRQMRMIEAAALFLTVPFTAMGQNTTPVPTSIEVPTGHVLHLTTKATGTQNYICLAGEAGPAWKFLGPQATLFVNIQWFGTELEQQVATHFLSMNPEENGVARATWQHSFDSSTVWAKAIGTSSDAPWVAEGAIPWLLLQVTGVSRRADRRGALAPTTYIQRINTEGGVAPGDGCSEKTIGTVTMVPYRTEYLFYRSENQVQLKQF